MLENIYNYGLIAPILYFIFRGESKIEVLIAIFISTYVIMHVVSLYTGIRIDISSYHDSVYLDDFLKR